MKEKYIGEKGNHSAGSKVLSKSTSEPWVRYGIPAPVGGIDYPKIKTTKGTKVIDFEELKFDVYNIQDELAEILISKHKDYGPKNISEAPGGPLNGLRVRMYDKIARLNNLVDNNVAPQNESLRDTLIDIANYATIGLLVIDGDWDK